MITHLNGVVEKVSDNSAVVDVNGVGYSVICSSKTLSEIQQQSGLVHLFTVLNIREDAWTLYGFFTEQERNWFNILISVQGVGGKVAIAILSALSDDEIYRAFLSGDKEAFTRADGVGAKLAARIMTELKDKVVGKGAFEIPSSSSTVPTSDVINDVISALLNLGYQRADVLRVISVLQPEKDCKFDTLLKQVLAKLSAGV